MYMLVIFQCICGPCINQTSLVRCDGKKSNPWGKKTNKQTKNFSMRIMESTSSAQIGVGVRNRTQATIVEGGRFRCCTISAPLQNPHTNRNGKFFSFLIFSGEAVAYCSIKQAGIHLIFPPGAVPEGSPSTVRRWNPRVRSPPLFDHEAVVSDVIELSLDIPGALHFDKTVTLVIPHCASNLKGYEVVVKCFSRDDDWKDVETADCACTGKRSYDFAAFQHLKDAN